MSDKWDKPIEYKARGIKMDYCRPFNANVKAGYIVRAPKKWKKESGMYAKAKWMALVMVVESKWWWLVFKRVKDFNYMPILNCPFCGKEP